MDTMDISKTLIVTDLDGTLLNSRAELTAFSLSGIHLLQQQGLTFTFATARSPHSAADFLSAGFINAPAILMNGVLAVETASKRSTIKDEESTLKTLYTRYLHEEAVHAMLRLIKDASLNAFLYTLSNGALTIFHEKPETDGVVSFIAARTKSNHPFVETGNLCDAASMKGSIYITLCDEREKLLDIFADIQKIEGVEAVLCPDNYSRFWYVECFSAAASKANGALFLKHHTKSENMIVFGDNHNDTGMFAVADLAVAVNSAQEDVKSAADCLCDSHDEDGVVKKLLEIFRQ